MGKPHTRITLYSASGCSHCKQARELLKIHRIPFQELDVQRSPRARKQLQRLGARGVPVIMVGKRRLDGFRPGPLRRLLREAGFPV